MAYIPGDKHEVFVSHGGQTTSLGVFDKWYDAKDERNFAFYRDYSIAAAWVMRYNDSIGSRREVYGHTLRRLKHERKRA